MWNAGEGELHVCNEFQPALQTGAFLASMECPGNLGHPGAAVSPMLLALGAIAYFSSSCYLRAGFSSRWHRNVNKKAAGAEAIRRPGIPCNYGRTPLPTGRTVWFMASVFAALMNARSRHPKNSRSGFVPDLPLQLANRFFESPPQRRIPVKREGPIPSVKTSLKSSLRGNRPSPS
jgi:hypothetical protein